MAIICEIKKERIIFQTMEELNRFDRFDEINYLFCWNCGLREIPVLPKKLRSFNCGFNQIREIKNLPIGLQKCDCCGNLITEIKNLPDNLQEFNCSSNHIKEIKNLPKKLRRFYCSFNQITEIKNLPDNLRVFDCCYNFIKEIKNLPNNLQLCIYVKYVPPSDSISFLNFFNEIVYNNPINRMEIKKWEYICQKNKERDEYINEHLSIPNVGIELGGFQSSLLIPPIDDIIGSLLYL